MTRSSSFHHHLHTSKTNTNTSVLSLEGSRACDLELGCNCIVDPPIVPLPFEVYLRKRECQGGSGKAVGMDGGWWARIQHGRRRPEAKESDVEVLKRLMRDAFADVMALRNRVDALVTSKAKSDAQERSRIGEKMRSKCAAAMHIDGKEACASLNQKWSRTDGRMDVEWTAEGWMNGDLNLQRMVVEAELPRGGKVQLTACGVKVTEIAPTLHVAEDGNGRDGKMGSALHRACQGGSGLAWHWMDPTEHVQCCLGAFKGHSQGQTSNSKHEDNKNLFGQVTARAAEGRLALALCTAQHGTGKAQMPARAVGMQAAATLTEDLAASVWLSAPWSCGVPWRAHGSSVDPCANQEGVSSRQAGPSNYAQRECFDRTSGTPNGLSSCPCTSWPLQLSEALFGLSITGTPPGSNNQLWGLSVGRVSRLPSGTWPFSGHPKDNAHRWCAEAFWKADVGEGTTFTPRLAFLHQEDLSMTLGASLEWNF